MYLSFYHLFYFMPFSCQRLTKIFRSVPSAIKKNIWRKMSQYDETFLKICDMHNRCWPVVKVYDYKSSAKHITSENLNYLITFHRKKLTHSQEWDTACQYFAQYLLLSLSPAEQNHNILTCPESSRRGSESGSYLMRAGIVELSCLHNRHH